jgi:hypothetical protein
VSTSRAGVALAAILLLASGCHGAGTTPADQAVDAGDDSPPGAPAAGTTACDDYVAATQNEQCGGAPLPADVLAHMQSRFRPVCARLLALPGANLSLASFEQCAQSIMAQPCGAFGSPPACPIFDGTRGTLPALAYCQIDAQCDSGRCDIPSGGVCGYCNQGIAPGQACGGPFGQGPPPPACQIGTSCVGGTCQPDPPGAAAGQPCGVGCAVDLVCGPGGTCQSRAGAGQPCTYDSECQPRLECLSGTCQGPEPQGQLCNDDSQCMDGLGCPYGPTRTCTPVTWANPGETCTRSVRCIYGNCPAAYPVYTGTCPRIVPDGEPCDPGDETQTCDAYSSCVAGTCQLWLSQTCQ